MDQGFTIHNLFFHSVFILVVDPSPYIHACSSLGYLSHILMLEKECIGGERGLRGVGKWDYTHRELPGGMYIERV